MILFAVASFVLIAILALSVDVGFMLAERRQAQSAADAAALAADMVYQHAPIGATIPTSAIEQSGDSYVEYNGLAASDAVIEPLATYTLPEGGTLERCVRVTSTAEVDTFFLGAVYTGDWEVAASAVACTSPVPREYAIVALNPGGTGITAVGTSNMTIHGGGAMSNSTVDFTGTANWIQPDGALDAYNGITNTNNTTVDADSMNEASPQISDPYANVPSPDDACGGAQPDPDFDPEMTVLQPGTYAHGISAKASDTANLVLAPGVYCFDGDFETQSGNSAPGLTIYGEGVLLYFRDGAELVVSGGKTGFNVSYTNLPAPVKASAPADVQAELTGGSCSAAACVAEMVVYYDRVACADLTLTGGNSLNVTGIIYAPCSAMKIAGHTGSEITGQIIAGSTDFAGTSELTITYSSSTAAMVPIVFLVQ